MTWWVLIYHNAAPKPTSLRVAAATNVQDHLFMAWSFVKPTREPIYRVVRGKRILCGYKYIWDTPNIAEQTQPGNTFTHSFYLPDLPERSVIWYYLFAPGGPYGLQIQGPLMSVVLPPILHWAWRVLAATQHKGIYYTTNFTGPEGDHPTWTRHNAGLDSLNIMQLHGDLYDPHAIQYAIIQSNSDRILYRRERAVQDRWFPILTDAEANALAGTSNGHIDWIASNLNLPGHLYVLFHSPIHTDGDFCIRSLTSGGTWAAHSIPTGEWNYTPGNITAGRAQGLSEHPAGDVLYASGVWGINLNNAIYASTDEGETWERKDYKPAYNARIRCHVDPSDQSTIYMGVYSSTNPPGRLYRSQHHGEILTLVDPTAFLGLNVLPHPTPMWIHPTNHAFLKVLSRNHVWQSWDYCQTWEDLAQTMVPVAHMHIVDATPGYYYLGRDQSAPLPPDAGWPHVLFASDDHGATLIGKCGAHAQQSDGGGDSIPYDCGGICSDGILPLY